MPNKSISELPAATQFGTSDLFAIEQGGVAKKLSGSTMRTVLTPSWGSITGNLEDQTDLNAVLLEHSSQIATIRAVTDRFYADAEGDLCEY